MQVIFDIVFGNISSQLTLEYAQEIAESLPSQKHNQQTEDPAIRDVNYNQAFNIYQDCVSIMLTQKNGLTSCVGNLVNLAKTSHSYLSFIAHLTLFEILRKLKYWRPAHFLASAIQRKIDNGTFIKTEKETILKLKINNAITLFYLRDYDQPLDCCHHVLDELENSKEFTGTFPVISLMTACYIMQKRT